MSKFICLVVCILSATLGVESVRGSYKAKTFTVEERKAIHEGVAPIVAECAKQSGVTLDDIAAAQKSNDFEKLHCFLACAFKKAGILTENGLYNTNSPLAVLKKLISEESYASYEPKGKLCNSVNDKAVSDGDAGCDRAILVKECFAQNGIVLVL